MKQLKESIKCFTLKEPLSEKIMWDIDVIHMRNRLPIFRSEQVGQDWLGQGEIGETIQ